MKGTMRAVIGASVTLLIGLLVVVQVSADDRAGLTVIVMEPAGNEEQSNQLGFATSLGGSRFETGDALLNGLAEAGGSHLAILVHEDLPMSEVLTLVSLASKAGYSDYSVLVFDDKRKGMAVVPKFRWVTFSENHETIASLLR